MAMKRRGLPAKPTPALPHGGGWLSAVHAEAVWWFTYTSSAQVYVNVYRGGSVRAFEQAVEQRHD